MLTLHSTSAYNKADYDLYTHPRITTDGRELLEAMKVPRWEPCTEVQLGMILSIQNSWKQQKDPRGGKFTVERFKKKFDKHSEQNEIPKNTKYAISKLREALRIYGLRVSSALQEERENWEQLDQLLNESLLETRYYWGAFSAELLRALTIPTTSVYSLLFWWKKPDKVNQQLQDSIIQKIQGILDNAPHEINSRISDQNPDSTTVFANPQESDFRK